MSPDFLPRMRTEWFGNIRADLLSGLVVALALIPEAIAFSIIAGVDPKIGLYASFSIAVITAIVGGRPGMISAATAATAVLMVTLVRDHGLQYLLAATILAGVLQVAAGLLKLGSVMRFVSRSVMTGFVNALAILIFMAQLPELIGVPWLTYVMVAAGLAIIYLFPYVTTAIPSPLVCIIALTAVATVACLITTPLILDLLVSHHMPAGFDMPSGRIAVEIGATLLLPLILGMLYLRMLPASAATFSKWCIRGSLFVIGLIVIGALTAGRLDLESFGLVNVGYVFGFVLALAAVSYGVPRLMGLSSSDVTAINVEVTVRNTNLGLLIKASLFPAVVGTSDPVGDNTLFAILLYGALMLLLSAALIPWHRRRNA